MSGLCATNLYYFRRQRHLCFNFALCREIRNRRIFAYCLSTVKGTHKKPEKLLTDNSLNKQSKKMSARQTPNEFLKQIIGRPVVVKLNNGVDYRGVLACLDGYMNIALEQTEEYSNGQLKNKYGDAFIRGNNVLFISTQKRRN